MKQILLFVNHTSDGWNGRDTHIERTHCAERNRSDQVTAGHAVIHAHAFRIYMSYIIIYNGLLPTYIALLISFKCSLYIFCKTCVTILPVFFCTVSISSLFSTMMMVQSERKRLKQCIIYKYSYCTRYVHFVGG